MLGNSKTGYKYWRMGLAVWSLGGVRLGKLCATPVVILGRRGTTRNVGGVDMLPVRWRLWGPWRSCKRAWTAPCLTGSPGQEGWACGLLEVSLGCKAPAPPVCYWAWNRCIPISQINVHELITFIWKEVKLNLNETKEHYENVLKNKCYLSLICLYPPERLSDSQW